MKKIIQALLLGFLVINLSGCPGDGGSDDDPSITGLGGSSGSSGTDGTSGTGDASGSDGGTSDSRSNTTAALLGSLNSFDAFVNGLISSSNKSILSTNDTTTLTVILANNSGTQVTEQAQYTFSSACLSNGKSEVSNNFVTNSDGTISVTYVARGCNGSDAVTATAETSAQTFTASVTLETSNSSVGGGTSGTTPSFLGSFNSFNAFVDGLIDSSNDSVLFTNDSTSLTVALADENGDAIAADAQYRFSSPCLSTGLSEVSESFVNNSAGSASITYFSRGCAGTDTVTAQATVGDQAFSASVDLELRQVVRIGSLDNLGAFVNGAIASGNNSTLVAGDSTELTVVLIDEDDEAVTTAKDIFFTSTCASNGLAEFDNSVAQNSDGTVVVNYTARGCNTTDTVTATTTFDGTTLTATVDLVTEQAPVGAIAFVGTDRNQIGLKGTDTLSNQATVTFQVTSDLGDPVPNETVTFELDTDIGGITLSKTSVSTDSDGLASTTVTAGSVNTPVRVRATAGTDFAESSALSITTGLPDQDSMSLSASVLNPDVFGADGLTFIHGIESELTIRLADRYNNPVADGTAVNFIAEGGVVEDRCFTGFSGTAQPPEEPNGVSGACSVVFTSANPRPGVPGEVSDDGRVTILATAIGEETFADINGNGVFDDGEAFDSIPEAFLDKNEDGNFTTGTGSPSTDDILVDFNNDGIFNPANAFFEGLLCDEALNAQCNQENQETLHVNASIVIVFAGDGLDDSDILILPSPINLTTGGSNVDVTVSIADDNGNPPPAGTTYEFATSHGVIIRGETLVTQGSTSANAAETFKFKIKPADAAGEGEFTVKATTPNGNNISASADVIQP